jgi:uncharacterized membrane protein YdbT with pleckstrin-like domain
VAAGQMIVMVVIVGLFGAGLAMLEAGWDRSTVDTATGEVTFSWLVLAGCTLLLCGAFAGGVAA